MRVKRAVRNRWLLAGLIALLAACGAPKTQTAKGDPPGEFAVQSIVAYCIGGTDAGIRVSWSASERALTYMVFRDGEQIAELGQRRGASMT